MFWIFKKIISLNLFDSDSNNASKIIREQQTTRLYVVLLAFTLIILTLYVSITKTLHVYVIQITSQADYNRLNAKYFGRLQCPCSKSQIPYENFSSISFTYHQICSSDFISPLFTYQLFLFNKTQLAKTDFMLFSAMHFTHIRLLCMFAQISVGSIQYVSKTSYYTSTKLVTQSVFELQLDRYFTSFESSLKDSLNAYIEDYNDFITNTYALSATFSPLSLQLDQNGNVQVEPGGFHNCSCLLHAQTCSTEGAFFDYHPLNKSSTVAYIVTGIRMACLPQFSTMKSSFACWYLSECYNKVLEFWRNRTSSFFFVPRLLDHTLDVKFNITDSIETILQNGMIDKLSMEASYEKYFISCAISYCSYSVYERQNIIIILTSLISIASGLSVALQLLAPLIINIVYWCLENVQGRPNMMNILYKLRERLISINRFFNRRTSSILTLTAELYSTRLYFILWSFVFAILLVHNSLSHDIITIKVEQPTEAIYETLSHSVSSSIECPCTQISFKYNSFVQLHTRLHQICYSQFVDMLWIESIYGDGNWSNLETNQFRGRGVVYFLILKSLCNVAQRIIDESIQEFLAKEIFKGKVITEENLLFQTEDEIYSSEHWRRISFITQLRAARGVMQSNHLMNVFSSNWMFSLDHSMMRSHQSISTRPVSHGFNCSCAISAACTEPVFVGKQLISGFLLGCFQLESILRSSLICLYNKTCLDLINLGNLLAIYPLDSTRLSRYMPNSTVEELALNTFVEEWKHNISYSTFFSQCQPSSCTYVTSQRKSVLQVITILLGLYGGLTLIIRFIVLRLMNMYSQLFISTSQTNNIIHPYS